MPRIEEQIDINTARADVFRFCYDFNRWPEWNEQVSHVELLSPKPIRAGMLLRIDAQHGSSAVFSWEAEIISYHTPSGSTIQALDTASSSPFAAGSKLIWEFSSVNGRARLSWVWDYETRGFVSSIKNKLGGQNTTRKAIKQSLINLKTLLEAGRRAG